MVTFVFVILLVSPHSYYAAATQVGPFLSLEACQKARVEVTKLGLDPKALKVTACLATE